VGDDHRGAPRAAARPTADLSGRVRLPRFRPTGRPARAGPVHARRRSGAHRPRVPICGLALPELALWPAVHPRQLRDRAARAGRRVVDVEGARGHLEPRGNRAGDARRHQAGPLAALHRRLCGPESGAARAGRRRRTQRHAAATGARRRTGTHRRSEPTLARRRRHAGRGGGDQGHRRACAAVFDARPTQHARAPARGGRHRGEPGVTGDPRADRLWLARVWLHQRRERAAAVGGDPQHARGDSSAGGTARHAELVAPLLYRGVRRGLRIRAVAHPARGRLARGGRVEHAGATAVHRLAVAVVCDLAAAASRGQWRSAPARRHARLVRLRPADPPAVRQWAAQPAAGHLPHAERLCSPPRPPWWR
jgi:hypothetical protein